MHLNHLLVFLKCRFWLALSGMGPEILHFWQTLWWFGHCWARITLISNEQKLGSWKQLQMEEDLGKPWWADLMTSLGKIEHLMGMEEKERQLERRFLFALEEDGERRPGRVETILITFIVSRISRRFFTDWTCREAQEWGRCNIFREPRTESWTLCRWTKGSRHLVERHQWAEKDEV